MKIVTVSLNLSLDKMYYFDNRIILGGMNRADRTNIAIGGKGLNITRVLKVLGIDVISIGLCGGTNGKYLIERLNSMNISNDFTATACETRLNIKLNSRNTQITELHEYGGPISDSEVCQLITKLNSINEAEEIDLLFLSGSVPYGVSPLVYKDIMETFSDSKAKVIVDAEGIALSETLQSTICQPFLIKPNQYEFELLTRKKYDLNENYDVEMRQIRSDIEHILSKHEMRILLSLGKYGAIYADNRCMQESEAPSVTLRDTTCAGDALLACFIAAYFGLVESVPKDSVETALSFATSGAAAMIERSGDIFPSYDDLFRYYLSIHGGL